MKTAEEILKEYWPELQDGSIRKRIIEAMQIYSDQQNKEKDAEIQRLTKEVDKWKEKAIRWQKLYGNEKTNNA